MTGGYDVTFPLVPKTSKEASVEVLSAPDERSLNCRLSVELLQAPFFKLEERLSCRVPEPLMERIVVARKLATYGFFCYEFHAVSVYWSVSCIEMALKLRFTEDQPASISLTRAKKNSDVPLYQLESHLRRGWRITGMPDFNYSFKALLKWAFEASLLPSDIIIPIQEVMAGYANRFELEIFPEWAQERGLLPDKGITLADIRACWENLSDAQRADLTANPAKVLTDELPNFRNEMAHPRFYNFVVVPGASVRAFDLLTDMVNRLWPDIGDSISDPENDRE
jgi:hypothetical protein